MRAPRFVFSVCSFAALGKGGFSQQKKCSAAGILASSFCFFGIGQITERTILLSKGFFFFKSLGRLLRRSMSPGDSIRLWFGNGHRG